MAAPVRQAPGRVGLTEFRRSFGPGLLWAGTAIGVSHLVQSTRAGATTGYALSGVVLAALVLKYPFFEFGPRYAAATGESLVDGYRRVGAWALWLYFLITVATAVIINATVALFAGFLVLVTVGLPPDAVVPAAAALFVASGLMLWRGRFRTLDVSIKAILIALTVSTLVAAAVSLPRVDMSTLALWPPLGSDGTSLVFVLALAGWMPSGVDVAAWSSLWTLAKDRATGARTGVATAQTDFLIGYVGTGALAFAFVTLGAAVMYGSGRTLSPEGAAFSLQLADLYAETLGGWARPFILVAALTTMLSTLLTVADGFPRAIDRSVAVLRATAVSPQGEPGRVYWASIVVISLLATVLLGAFGGTLTALVDFATVASFLTAPVLGYLNLRVVTGSTMPRQHRPGPAMLALAYTGLVLLATVGIVFLIAGRA
jgi:Mn2+/Fe2+ NRAMP family transporter